MRGFLRGLLRLAGKGGGKLRSLEKRTGHLFRDRSFLELALSHRSYALSSGGGRGMSNERMEFLGDAVLGFVISDFLMDEYPDRGEGELSRIKSLIISRKALKAAADRIGLSEFLLISRAEEKTGGRDRFSINTNAFEALIAAVYLDGGIKEARRFIRAHVIPLIPELLKDEDFCNYKSKLLEAAQAGGGEAPHYRVVSEDGPDHDKVFTVAVSFGGREYGLGKGKNKKEAEQSAARAALEEMDADKRKN